MPTAQPFRRLDRFDLVELQNILIALGDLEQKEEKVRPHDPFLKEVKALRRKVKEQLRQELTPPKV